MEKISDPMINTLLAFDAYEYGAMTGHVIKAWMHQLAAEVKESRAQLAAEASAVGELKQAYETAREMPCDANPFSEGRKSGYVRGLLDALDIVTNHRVAALVQAEGTQPNSTESEVRE